MSLEESARFLATAAFVFSTLTIAQTTTGIAVRVVDPTGAAIPRPEIQIGTSPDSLGPALFGDNNGVFLTNLPEGAYYVRASSQGFRTRTQRFAVDRLKRVLH